MRCIRLAPNPRISCLAVSATSRAAISRSKPQSKINFGSSLAIAPNTLDLKKNTNFRIHQKFHLKMLTSKCGKNSEFTSNYPICEWCDHTLSVLNHICLSHIRCALVRKHCLQLVAYCFLYFLYGSPIFAKESGVFGEINIDSI